MKAVATWWALVLVVVGGCGGTPAPRVTGALAVRPATPTPGAATAPPALPAGCSPRAVACVSTHARLEWLQLHGHLVGGPYPVSLGDRRHPTPTGVFHVARKDREHASSTYGTDMPYAVFFAAGGVAFHAGALDEPSHGCVHLARGPAAAFFAVLEPGNRVEVR